MYSRDFNILVERLQRENEKHRMVIAEMQFGKKEFNQSKVKIHIEYMQYHEEMINFIKKLDKELGNNVKA